MTPEDYLSQGTELAEHIRNMHCAETAIRMRMQGFPAGNPGENATPEERMKYGQWKRRLEWLQREGARDTERLLDVQEEISQAISGVSDRMEREILRRIHIWEQSVPDAARYMDMTPQKAWKLYQTALTRIQVPEESA